MITVKDFKEGKTLPAPLYVNRPYVILNKDGVILCADTLENCLNVIGDDYYDNCEINIRRYDLYLNDNTLIAEDVNLTPLILRSIRRRFDNEFVVESNDDGLLITLDGFDYQVTVNKIGRTK